MITRFTEVIESNNFLSKDMNTFMSEDDIYCNFDKFERGETHVCFVTGVSGSGKSTLSKKLARKYNANYIELDIVMYALDKMRERAGSKDKTRQRLREEHPWIYEWIMNTHQDEETWPKLTSEKMSTYDFHINKTMELIDWLRKTKGWSGSKPPKFIIDGADLVNIIPMRLEYTEYPFIFKGTSKIKAALRRAQREGGLKNYYSDVKGIIELIKAVYGDYYWATSMQADQTAGRYMTINRDSSNAKEVDEDSLTAKKMGIIFSDDDVHYNIHRFLNKEVPILWITGMSGGGKTTLANQICDKTKCDLFGIDDISWFINMIIHKETDKIDRICKQDKTYAEIYKFLLAHPEYLVNNKHANMDNWMKCIVEVVDIVVKRHTKKNQVIIEGVQIPYIYYRRPKYFETNCAIIIKGTSVLQSVVRRFKRDQFSDYGFIHNAVDVLHYMKLYAMWYRTQNEFRDFVTPNKESYIDPAIIHMQTTDYTCAPACALTLMHYYTGSVDDTEANIASIMGTNKDVGTTIHGVIKYFKQIGWTVNSSIQEGSPLAYEDFELFLDYNLGHDNIIMVENKFLDGHWRIIIGYDKDNEQLTFIDPYSNINNGIAVMSARDFFTTWYDDNIDSSKTWVTAKPPKDITTESTNTQLYILPIDISYAKNNESLLSINTHNVNIALGLIDTLKTQPWNLFSYIGLADAWIEQHEARDFCLLDDKDPTTFSNRFEGCPVYAIADGEVVYVGKNIFPYGNCVCIKHKAFATYSTYCHFKDNTITVKVGDIVNQGHIIGKVGNTGNSSAPHLHFEMSMTPFYLGRSLSGFEHYKYIELKDTDLWGVKDFSKVVAKHKSGKWRNCTDGEIKNMCLIK